jgi:hypothetical protein
MRISFRTDDNRWLVAWEVTSDGWVWVAPQTAQRQRVARFSGGDRLVSPDGTIRILCEPNGLVREGFSGELNPPQSQFLAHGLVSNFATDKPETGPLPREGIFGGKIWYQGISSEGAARSAYVISNYLK